MYPILIGTNNHKGGDVRFARFLMTFKNVKTPDCYISSLLDYFRIDSEWPGQDIIRENLKRGVSLSKINLLDILNESTIEGIIIEHEKYCNNFVPNFEMHEFETLLFSDVKIMSDILQLPESDKYFFEILKRYHDDPELINTVTAPSKIILAKKANYKKTVDGLQIAEKIGIEKIREQCSCFNEWVEKLITIV
ncbi:MAG: DUF4276 family protein [Spirochaetaceae bacterium]|nr:DUF4276 family protein [Spirochaetaceae bacterium]